MNATHAARNGAKTAKPVRDNTILLKTLISFKGGNFSARMPVDQTGVEGKVADTLNDILDMNEKLVAELARISKAVGKEGKITQRASIGAVTGAWADSVESVNSLIGDLVQP